MCGIGGLHTPRVELSTSRVCAQLELNLKTLSREKRNPKLTRKTRWTGWLVSHWVSGCIDQFWVLLKSLIFGRIRQDLAYIWLDLSRFDLHFVR